MNVKKFFYWLPRILMILFIAFISLFALDVFSEYSGFELLTALFMHLIPSLVLVAFLVVAWKWEKLGGILIIVLSIIFFFAFDVYESWISFLILVLPLVIVGVLFLISSRRKK